MSNSTSPGRIWPFIPSIAHAKHVLLFYFFLAACRLRMIAIQDMLEDDIVEDYELLKTRLVAAVAQLPADDDLLPQLMAVYAMLTQLQLLVCTVACSASR
eukprot:49203-Eustigmatos_ZCMA.PRE.1